MRIITLFGIDLRLNFFFILLFIIFWYFDQFFQSLIIFCVVFLHELGHVVVAAGYGLKVKQIELLPFGGVARLEGSIELNPLVEIYVAMAGPLTNGFLVLTGYLLGCFGMGNQQWLPFFIECNVMIGIFNLLPAFPLDGGRIFRALTTLYLGVKKGTDKAVFMSKLIGVIMIFIGVWSVFTNEGQNLNFLVIAVFLIYSSIKEKRAAMFIFMKFLTRKKDELFREGILLSRQVVALDTLTVNQVVKYFVPRKYHLVVVINHAQKVEGTLTEGEIIDNLLNHGPDTPLGVLVHNKK